MTDEASREGILRWFKAVNQGDINLLNQLADELFTPDFIEHDPSMPDFEPGPAGVKKIIRQVRQENTNVHATVHDIFTWEHKAAYRFTLSMTNITSGKPVNIQLLAITRFVGSQIAEEWQLGVPGEW